MTKESLSNLNDIAFKRIGHYQDRPAIIFLHDSLGCIELWRDFPERLSRLIQCNLIVYDRQGYGKSGPFSYPKRGNDYLELEAAVLNELLHQWGVSQAFLFGHSDGGSIALIAAAKYPSKIMGVITEGAHVFVENITVNGIKEAAALYKTSDLKTKLKKYHGDKTDSMFWAWAATWLTDEFSSWNIAPFLPMIECPLLVIQGRNDEYGTLRQVEAISNGTAGKATQFIIDEVGHTPHKEAPGLVLEKTAGFIEKILRV